MFENFYSRECNLYKFPCFVENNDIDKSSEFSHLLINEEWVKNRWREAVEDNGWKRNKMVATKIVSHGGYILEICAGPGGGFMPAILMKNYNANILLSDLRPIVIDEWHNHFTNMINPPPNIEYAAFDVCDIPIKNDSIDVVSGSAAIINIEGDIKKALCEVFRILKKGGLFVFDYTFITEEYYNKLPLDIAKKLKAEYPYLFWDALDIFDNIGFTKAKTILRGNWSNKNDRSGWRIIVEI
jgi:ubiquinone/menaquinone biosynthesis C-methylase UbiE